MHAISRYVLAMKASPGTCRGVADEVTPVGLDPLTSCRRDGRSALGKIWAGWSDPTGRFQPEAVIWVYRVCS